MQSITGLRNAVSYKNDREHALAKHLIAENIIKPSKPSISWFTFILKTLKTFNTLDTLKTFIKVKNDFLHYFHDQLFCDCMFTIIFYTIAFRALLNYKCFIFDIIFRLLSMVSRDEYLIYSYSHKYEYYRPNGLSLRRVLTWKNPRAYWRHVLATCTRTNTYMNCVVRIYYEFIVRFWEFLGVLGVRSGVFGTFTHWIYGFDRRAPQQAFLRSSHSDSWKRSARSAWRRLSKLRETPPPRWAYALCFSFARDIIQLLYMSTIN